MDDSPLAGRWQMIRAEFAGERAPDVFAERTQLLFTADRYEVSFESASSESGRFEATGEGATRSLLLHATAGASAGRTIPCIFQRVGDRLRICFGLDGHPPPHFTTAAGQPRYLATYRLLAD